MVPDGREFSRLMNNPRTGTQLYIGVGLYDNMTCCSFLDIFSRLGVKGAFSI